MMDPESATLSVSVIRAIFLRASHHGLDPEALARRYALPPETFRDVDARTPAMLVVRMWREISEECRDPHFGLLLGEQIGQIPFSVMGHLVAASPDLRHGARRAIQYYRVVNDAHPIFFDETSDGHGVIWCSPRGAGYDLPHHPLEFAWAWLAVFGRKLLGEDAWLDKVTFEHAAPADLSHHERVFRCPMEFNAPRYELRVCRAVLDTPNQSADPHLADILESHIRHLLKQLPENPKFSARVRQSLAREIPHGRGTIEEVARGLHLSVRSLQRHLHDEGTSFNDVFDAVRKDLALAYLRNATLSIGEVACILGFSDQSAFHRAFTRWMGVTPGAWRRSGA